MSTFIRSTSCAAAHALTAVSLMAGATHAAADAANPANTDASSVPIVVTAARIAQSQADVLPHTTVISSTAIRNSQATDLPTLLRNEAGLQFTQSGAPGQSLSLFMRGATPGQVLILIDGVPARRQDFSSAAALEHLLPEQIDHIEIVRGNVSAIYGSGAIGGVIQIFTRRGSATPVMEVSAEAGARGTRRVAADLAGQGDTVRYAVSATHYKTDGFAPMNASQFPNENPASSGYENNSASVALSNQWAPGHEFGTRLYANDGKFQFSGGGFGAPTDINKGTSQQQSLALFSRDELTADWTSTVTLSQTRTRGRYLSISEFGYDNLYRSTSNLLQWANELRIASDWTLVAGIDAGRDRFDATSDDGFSITRNTPSRSTSSVYAGINGKVAAHELQVNLRHDDVGGAGSKATGYLGYGYVLTPAFKLIASASTAFNAPTLSQSFDPQYGNPGLKPESSRSLEIGAQYAAGAALLRATLFKTRTEDQFGYDSDFRTININRASNRGLEFSAGGALAGVDLKGSLTLQEPTDDTTGQLLARRARTLASLSAAQAFGAWKVGGDLQYTGKRSDGSKDLSGYVLANLTARYAVSTSVSLFARIDNLFDRDYQTVYGYNQPPRGVFAGVRWQQ